jgi:hypothetical protein
MPSVREWVVISGVIALVMIPICWYFWKKFDLPSRLARREMSRRRHERDVREAFQLEEAKLLEIQRLEAQMELARKKTQAPAPVEKGELYSAFGSLSGEEQDPSTIQAAGPATDSTGTEVMDGSADIRRDDSIEFDASEITVLVDSLDDSAISDGGEAQSDAPKMMRFQSAPKDESDKQAADSVDWSDPSDEPDDWKEVNW